jgi:folate-binding protein YgfZ
MAYVLEDQLNAAGARVSDNGQVEDYGDPALEYAAAVSGAGLLDARSRGLIEVTGSGRAVWLHNLTTNTVKTLQPGEGNYTFATNVKGRILLDFNAVVLADAIWIDIDRQLIAKALAHFNRYLIAEDVRLRDRSDEFVRIALTGPKAAQVADAVGATQAPVMASLGSAPVMLVQKRRLLVRHDFAGVFGAELYIEAEDAPACWSRLIEIGRPVGLRPIGNSVVEVLRIEAGIPLYGKDIDEEVLPAETQQIERAISYVKGCYLGQEVVERMRSHGALARKLIGLRLERLDRVEPGMPLRSDGVDVGRITSLCYSFALQEPVGLGYAKTALAHPGTALRVGPAPDVEARVAPLPFRPATLVK